jgi:protein-serine/threonine kinase
VPSREDVQTPVPPTSTRSRKTSAAAASILPEVSRPPVKYTLSASTSKAQKVMQWFRGGKQRAPSDSSTPEVIVPIEGDFAATSGESSANFPNSTALESTSTINRFDAPPITVTPASPEKGRLPNPLNWLPGRSVSSGPSTLLPRGGGNEAAQQKPVMYDPALIRIHHGAVDVGTVASGSPPELFHHVTQVLMTMGVEIQQEAEYKYRCIRPKKRRDGQSLGLGLREPNAPTGLTAFSVSGSATLNGVSTIVICNFSPLLIFVTG